MDKYIVVIFTILILGSCVSTEINPPSTNGFFDLSDYLEKEMAEKKGTVKKIKKTVTLDGVTETQALERFDLEKETDLFRTADINKVAWLDRYETDSILYKNGQLERLIYKSTDDNLRTKSLMVHYDTKNTIDSILIEQSSVSKLAESTQQLLYLPAVGYRIENQQNITALDPHKLIVDVVFVY